MIGSLALGLAAVAVAGGREERAARLLGAAARLSEELGTESDVFEQRVQGRAVADARAVLGEETFTAAFAQGQAMAREEIVQLCEEHE